MCQFILRQTGITCFRLHRRRKIVGLNCVNTSTGIDEMLLTIVVRGFNNNFNNDDVKASLHLPNIRKSFPQASDPHVAISDT